MRKYKFSDFEKKVYKAILNIPIGETRSYSWVAKKIGKPKSSRAVGTALKKNPFAPLLPCHRVICHDGKLGGYNGGIKKKIKLINIEKHIRQVLSK